MMTKTDKITFVEAPAATLEVVTIELINGVPAPTSKLRQTSLVELGQVDPVRLSPINDGRFDIVDGRRRVANAKAVGLETVVALVEQLTGDRATLYSLVQMSRDPNPMMEAKGIARLLRNRTQEQVAKLLGITQSLVSQRAGLLDLIPELQDRLEVGTMTLTAARSAKKLDRGSQEKLSKMDKITVKAAKAMLRNYQAEMIDLSCISIPEIATKNKIVLSRDDIDRIANGGQVQVVISGQAVIITAS